jgi:hypothetical protein
MHGGWWRGWWVEGSVESVGGFLVMRGSEGWMSGLLCWRWFVASCGVAGVLVRVERASPQLGEDLMCITLRLIENAGEVRR